MSFMHKYLKLWNKHFRGQKKCYLIAVALVIFLLLLFNISKYPKRRKSRVIASPKIPLISIPPTCKTYENKDKNKKTLSEMFNSVRVGTLPHKPLDCVVLTIHISQIKKGLFDVFLKHMKKASSRAIRPPFYIVTSSPLSNLQKMSMLNSFKISGYFNDYKFIEFVSFEIKKEDDKYMKRPKKSFFRGYIFQTNGPNEVFFNVMEYFAQISYSTILLLEPDVKFVKDYWFDTLYDLSVIEPFWVLGSSYKGQLDFSTSSFADHINGVALYNIGNDSFRNLLKIIKCYLSMNPKYSKKPKEQIVNYDTAWSYLREFMISDIITQTNAVRTNYALKIQQISALFCNTNTIVNISPSFDRNITKSAVMKVFPSVVIIHQKE